MSNALIITPTCFVSLEEDGTEADRDWGIVASDNFVTGMRNGLSREEVVGVPPSVLVDMAEGMPDEMAEAVSSARENDEGVHIGSHFHSWASIEAGAAPGRPGA